MNLLFMLLCSLFSWVAFTCSDYLDEMNGTDIFLLTILLAIGLTLAAYIRKERTLRPDRASSVREAGGFLLKWVGVSAVIGAVFVTLMNWGVWPVEQNSETLLNGLEYHLFAAMYPVGVVLLVLLWSIGRGIFFWQKQKRKSTTK